MKKYTDEELKYLIFEGDDDFDSKEDIVIDTWRWGVVRQCILQHKETKEYYAIKYTTQPEEGIQEVYEMRKVKPVEKVSIEWVDVENE